MSNRFITFKPVTGKFKKAIHPYKKWNELADMSPPIEVEGKYYRILRITGLINKLNTRKMVMCDEGGHLIEDKDLSCKCVKITQYLDTYQMNNKAMILSSKDDTPAKLREFILEFKKMIANIAQQLTEKEKEAMEQQLYYYEKTKLYSEDVMKDAIELKSYIHPLEENQVEKFSSSFITNLRNLLNRWEQNKYYIQALLIENNGETKKVVRKILRNPDNQSYFPNQTIKKEMLDEMLQSEMAVTRFIEDGKHGWEREKKYLHPDKGKFNIKSYLDDLWNRNNAEIFMQVHVNEFINDYWLFSPTKIHS